MLMKMGTEMATLLKRLWARRALIWSLACVSAQMPYQRELSREALGTQVAFTRPLARVGKQVLVQCGLLFEALWTQMALEWPLACVNSHVLFQVEWTTRLVAAEGAVVIAFQMQILCSCWTTGQP